MQNYNKIRKYANIDVFFFAKTGFFVKKSSFFALFCENICLIEKKAVLLQSRLNKAVLYRGVEQW